MIQISEVFIQNGWIIVKDDFPSRDVMVQENLIGDVLYEDMFQGVFKSDNIYVADIGWYGITVDSGRFICYIIKDGNWDSPVVEKELSTILEVFDFAKVLAERRWS